MTTSPREELARIIDPVAFSTTYRRNSETDEQWLERKRKRIVKAIAKADEWLSRHPVKAASPEGVEDKETLRCALEDLQIEYGHAQREALALAVWLHKTYYSDVTEWKPFDKASSILSQIDNMVAGVHQRLVKAESTPPASERAEVVGEFLEIRERHMDGIDAGRRVHDWIDAVAKADDGQVVSREKRVLSFTEDDGGAVLYMRDNRVAAAGMIVRDLHNFSIAMRMFEPAAPAPAQQVEPVAWRYRQLHHEIDGPITGWSYVESEPVWLAAHHRWEVEALGRAATPPKPPEAPAVAEGWKLVPDYPTVEMLAAYCRQMNTGTQEIGEHREEGRYQVAAYQAMLAAAPNPESQGQGGAS